MAWRLVLCSSFVLGITLTAPADTLGVAGRPHPATAPFITGNGEVLAPLLPVMPALGIKAFARGPRISLVTPDGTACRLELGSTTAHLGERAVPLPLPPRAEKAAVLLPTFALARLLPFTARYTARTRRLSLLPLLTVTCTSRGREVSITLRSPAPLDPVRKTLANPPRVYFDLPGVAIAGGTQLLQVHAGGITRLRAVQHAAPDGVRVVVDLERDLPLQDTAGDGGRVLTITTDAPDDRPVTLQAIALQSRPGRQSELVLTASGPFHVNSRSARRDRLLILEIRQCSTAMPARQLRALHDARIRTVTVAALPGRGLRLAVALAAPLEYAIRQEGRRLYLRLGGWNLHGMRIVLDAGHGGVGDEGPTAGPGAAGCTGLIMEREVNLDVVQRLAPLLARAGATVSLTRGNAEYLSLDDRVALANRDDADLFLAVHCNSAGEQSACGTETYYYTPGSAALAAAIHPALVAALNRDDRGIHNGVKFQVIAGTRMPAVLVELAFISNKEEEALLATTAFRQQAADGLAAGIRDYAAGIDWRALRRARDAARKAGKAEGADAARNTSPSGSAGDH